MGREADGSSSTVKRGSAEIVNGIAAMACRSIPEQRRGAAGVTGARFLCAGRVQHEGVAHLAGSKSQHRQTGFETGTGWPASASKALCQPVALASSKASRADEVLCNALAITVESLGVVEPLQNRKAMLILQLAATEHLFAHVRVFDGF